MGAGDGVLDHVLSSQFNPASQYGDCTERESLFVSGRIDNECDVDHFWSLHVGGAYFARADGSVGFVSYGEDGVLRTLASRLLKPQ